MDEISHCRSPVFIYFAVSVMITLIYIFLTGFSEINITHEFLWLVATNLILLGLCGLLPGLSYVLSIGFSVITISVHTYIYLYPTVTPTHLLHVQEEVVSSTIPTTEVVQPEVIPKVTQETVSKKTQLSPQQLHLNLIKKYKV